VKMAFKAHQREMEVELGRSLGKDDHDAWRRLTDSYQRLTLPWLGLNAEVGNIYTGSLFLSLIDLLRQAAESLSGREISLFSYGSGCGATYSIGRIEETAAAWRQTLDPADELAARRRLSVAEYEDLIEQSECADTAETLDPAEYGLPGGLYYLGTRDHVRQYARG